MDIPLQFTARSARLLPLLRPVAVAALLALTLAGRPLAAAQDGAATPDDGPTFPIGQLSVEYLKDNPLHPLIIEAMAVAVTLGETDTGYVAPREDVPVVTMSLAEISERPPENYHASALQHILETLRDFYVAQDLLGVYVAPNPEQINEIGQDVRPAGEPALTIIVTTGIVTEMRTLASGERVGAKGQIPADERIDNPVHRRILERSPIAPYDEATSEERKDLLRKDELDRYLFHLGRHPGRRVDASVAAAQEIGGIDLDYIVTENKPLFFYLQFSNTGTSSTDYGRQRVGMVHTQLTNYDDILSIDYTTAWFDEVNVVNASYDRPFENDRVRWRVYGGYNEYNATQVGFVRDVFTGETYYVGGEIAGNVYQKRELFVDVLGGLNYSHYEVNNKIFDITGRQGLLYPYVGVRLDRTTEWFSTRGTLTFDIQAGDISGADEEDLVPLGRVDPDVNWVAMRYDLSHNFFLEPFLDRKAWEDPTTPKSSTLAHEVQLWLRGQYAFNNRLIPQQQFVAGGLYTVRGYPQSVVAGDSSVIGTVEYRYHVPRAFALEPEPRELFGQPFRRAPQYVYGSPDWDLVLKAFIDAGAVFISDAEFFEEDSTTLVGAGIGFDFVYRRNLTVRVDWGFILDAIPERQANSGSNRLNFVVTVLF